MDCLGRGPGARATGRVAEYREGDSGGCSCSRLRRSAVRSGGSNRISKRGALAGRRETYLQPAGALRDHGRMEVPETRYAKTSDGVHLAYHIVGDGPVDVALRPVRQARRGRPRDSFYRTIRAELGARRLVFRDELDDLIETGRL